MSVSPPGTQCIVGTNAVVSTNATINHDPGLGDRVHAMSGAATARTVTIGGGTTIGRNATVRRHIRLGAGVVVGAGPVITRDVGDATAVLSVWHKQSTGSRAFQRSEPPGHAWRLGMPDPEFEDQPRASIAALKVDQGLRKQANEFLITSSEHKYSYNFDWLGLPIIQFPPDIVVLQELIWRVKPQVVVETGVARGGSLALSASILELLGGERFVVGVDIEIRQANRAAIEAHPLAHRIRLVQGSSVDNDVVEEVYRTVGDRSPVVVLLDSMHTHAHVLEELRAYHRLVSEGSYIVVFDTVIADMPEASFPDRPWGVHDNPKNAVKAFLRQNDRFVVDEDLETKLQITVCPSGYLRCVH